VVIRARRESWATRRVVAGVRIGITKAVELPWRFCVAGNPHVSRPRLG
jgi:DNA-3-methyladenine glycosylase